MTVSLVGMLTYEGESISNQPFPLPMDGFSCLVSIHVLYMGTKLQTYRVILYEDNECRTWLVMQRHVFHLKLSTVL